MLLDEALKRETGVYQTVDKHDHRPHISFHLQQGVCECLPFGESVLVAWRCGGNRGGRRVHRLQRRR